MDKMVKINLWITGENTWQGIIDNNWPYDKIPLKIQENFNPGTANIRKINLVENNWKYLDGQKNFEECFDIKMDLKSSNCISMFHPYSYNFNER